MSEKQEKFTEVSRQTRGNGRTRRNDDVPSKGHDPKSKQDALPTKQKKE